LSGAIVERGTRYHDLGNLWVTKPYAVSSQAHRKNGFITATKLGTTNNFFVAATKNFAAATIRFVDRTKHFVIPILTNDFVGITKPFIPCGGFYLREVRGIQVW